MLAYFHSCDSGNFVFRWLSDDQIIFRVQNGERHLFSELHTRHQERILNFVARSIWERDSAHDVASEVWLRALCAIDRFEIRAGASVLAWLLRIAANLITDYRRRLHPAAEPLPTTENEVLTLGHAPPAETSFWQRERRRALAAAFAQLSPGDQTIIALAHAHDLSSLQIARALDKPSVSAVTSHLHRAMTHLRAALQEAGWD